MFLKIRESFVERKNSIITLALAISHIFFIFYFIFFLKNTCMIFYNILSTSTYILLYKFTRKHTESSNEFIVLTVLTIEISVFAILIHLMLSAASGSGYYLLGMSAAIFLYSTNIENSFKRYLFLSLLPITALLVMNLLPQTTRYVDSNPIYIKIMRLIAIPYTIGALILLSVTIRDRLIRTSNDNKKYIDELKFFSNYDPLTKILNRRSMQKLLKEMPLYTLVMFDIDDFKKLNDNYGHEFGDFVLTELTKRISASLTDDTAFSRWGGEEFLIVYPYHSEATILSITELNSIVSKDLYKLNDTEVKVTITGGVSFSKPGVEFDKVLSDADELLYIGKSKGKNQIVFPKTY